MIRPKTDIELLQLAKDINAGLVFTDRHLDDIQNLRVAFLPLSFMAKEQLERLDDVGLFYEYLVEAAPKQVHDFPVFFTVQTLSKLDAATLTELLKDLSKTLSESPPLILPSSAGEFPSIVLPPSRNFPAEPGSSIIS